MKLLPLAFGVTLLLQTAPPAPATELRFNWPRDISARVETEKTRERQMGGTTKSSTVKASYRMRALPHPDGLLIRYDDFRLGGVPSAEMAAASDLLTSLMPNLIVDATGDFVRVDDIGSLKSAVATLFEPLQKAGRELPTGLKDVMSRFLTEEVLTSLAGQEWQLLVGAWQQLALSTDKFEMETEEPSPVLPAVKVPMKVSGGLIEKGTCARGGAKIDCVVVEMRSLVDQAAMQAIMTRLLEGMKDMQGLKYDRMDVVTVTRVRLETHTMVPHDLMTTKTVEMVMTVPGEGRIEGKQIDRRTSRFTY